MASDERCQKTKNLSKSDCRYRYQCVQYTVLARDNDSTQANLSEKKYPEPSPIFVYGVVNDQEMIKNLQDIAEDEQYTTRSMANNTIKINCVTPDTHRKLIKHFNYKNIIYHTYQLREDRAYRIAIKYLHHSMDTKRHEVRNIINAI